MGIGGAGFVIFDGEFAMLLFGHSFSKIKLVSPVRDSPSGFTIQSRNFINFYSDRK